MTNTALTSNEIKECPVCHSWCFTDMEVCYGCLHDFTKDQSRISQESSSKQESESSSSQAEQPHAASVEQGNALPMDQRHEQQRFQQYHQQPVTLADQQYATPADQRHEQQLALPVKQIGEQAVEQTAEQKSKTPQPFGLLSGQRLEVVLSFRVVDA